MSKTPKKPDLRDRDGKGRPHVSLTNTDVRFAGAENRSVMPGSGQIVSPDPGEKVEGQTSKG